MGGKYTKYNVGDVVEFKNRHSSYKKGINIVKFSRIRGFKLWTGIVLEIVPSKEGDVLIIDASKHVTRTVYIHSQCVTRILKKIDET